MAMKAIQAILALTTLAFSPTASAYSHSKPFLRVPVKKVHQSHLFDEQKLAKIIKMQLSIQGTQDYSQEEQDNLI